MPSRFSPFRIFLLLFALSGLATNALSVHAQSIVTASISDPSLNGMRAFNLSIPAGWRMQGTVMQGRCVGTPFIAFRAYAPDGLTEMRTMPIFAWTWRPNLRGATPDDCLPLTGKLTAEQFLARYVETIPGGVHVVGPMPVTPLMKQRADQLVAQMQANNANLLPPIRSDWSADEAAIRIQTVNGSFVVEQRIRAVVVCNLTQLKTGPLAGGHCMARTDVLRAPQGKLDALVALVDGHDLPKATNTPEWQAAVLRRQQAQGQAMMDALRGQEQAESDMLHRQHEQIMATMEHNHQAFMAQQESSFQSSMRNAGNAMNARTTAASDWVDYALDRQTVNGSGGLTKVSSAYSQTWSNGNQWFQTNDPNSNPNGSIPGNWTLQTKVHGNGQSY